MSPTSALRWCLTAAFAGIGSIALTGCGFGEPDRVQGSAHQIRYRPIEGRIYGSPYVSWSGADARSGTAVTQQNARKIAWRIFVSKQPEELRAREALSAGDVRYAKRLLEGMTSRGKAGAAAWSDYSAALLADAAPDDAFELATALAAADHALDLDSNLPEALFNRALALERMSLRRAAITAYRKYLHVDEGSPWRPEAQSRLEKLESAAKNAEQTQHAIAVVAESNDELLINDTAIAFPQESRHWGEGPCLGAWAKGISDKDTAGAAALMLTRCRIIGRALESQFGDSFLADTVRAIDKSDEPKELAHKHVAYERGRMAFSQMNLAASISALEKAQRGFEVLGSPMALRARLYLATVSLQTGNAERIPSMLRDLSRQTPERYCALRAQIQWMEGLSATISGNNDAALKHYRSASAAFTALGEQRNAAVTRELETTVLAQAGRTAEAWHLRHTTLAWTTEAGDDYRLTPTLYGAALDATLAGRWDLAHAFLNTSIETVSNEWLRDELLAWRLFAAHRAGMFRTAAAERRAAHAVERRSNELALVEALLATNPAEALSLLDEPLRAAEQQGNKIAISQLLVERARLFRATGQTARAQDDLERAVALIEARPTMSSRTIRDAFLGTPERAYSMLADSLDARGETDQALNTLERLKMRVGGEDSQSAKLLPISFHFGRLLPPQTLLITYGVFDDRFVIYASDSRQLTRTTLAVNRWQVARLVSTFDDAIARNDRLAFRNASRSLEQILVEPIAKQAATADTLVFVHDSVFDNLPFSALVDPNNRFLVEEHAVIVAPSICSYLRASHTKTATSRALLSVGNSFSREPSDPLPTLPGAESEAKEIATLYPSHALLVRGDATKARVTGALPYCDVAHFAVHANAGVGDTMPPHLILSRTSNSEGILTPPEIASLSLNDLRTVVLAGCSTAISPTHSRTDSLVNAFLAAGAGSVIGTLWNVEDAPTRTMSIAFHRELIRGSTPAQALRATQLEMIRGGSAPSEWASFQLYGSGR